MEHPLRTWRKDSGLTLDTMSAMLDLSTASLSRIETGKQQPALGLVRKVATLTRGKVPVEAFVRYQPQQAAE